MPTYKSLLYQIAHRIRQSLALPDILDTTVQEIQDFLAIDRVKIYQFHGDGSGEVVAEAVNTKALTSLLNLHFPAGDIPFKAREQFIQERQRVIVDVDVQQKSVSQRSVAKQDKKQIYGLVDPCHVSYLQAMGVKASLVMPILYQGNLWGLLAVHHSQARYFSAQELSTLELLADQLEIAIAQSYLLTQARQQVQQEATINQINQLLHCPLDPDEVRQRILATTVTALAGHGGQLYLTTAATATPAALCTVGQQPPLDLSGSEAWQQLLHQNRQPFDNWPGLATGSPFPARRSQLDGSTTAPELRWLHHEIVPEIYTLQDLAAFPQLQAAFQAAHICTCLVSKFWFQEDCLGYLVIFRMAYDSEIRWAGYRNFDRRDQRPRISFEMWRELRRNQVPVWTAENLRLMRAISLHIYMSTLQQQLTNKLRYQAYHDSLTKLANRLLFTEQLGLALIQAEQNQDMLAIAFLDLDRFKNINDSLGHKIGDRLLSIVASRLKETLRPHDIVARWGGDEFTLLFPHLLHSQEIVDLANLILQTLAQPMRVDHQDLVITGSLGLAIAPYDGDSADLLLKKADAALSEAKRRGKNTFQFFCQEQTALVHNLMLEGELRKAIEQEDLSLWYQLQVKIETGEVTTQA